MVGFSAQISRRGNGEMSFIFTSRIRKDGLANVAESLFG
jgi:hypothetical protein